MFIYIYTPVYVYFLNASIPPSIHPSIPPSMLIHTYIYMYTCVRGWRLWRLVALVV